MHLKKLCVGCDSIDDLAGWQKQRLREMKARGEKPRLRHVTRHAPKQADIIMASGSLFWIIKGWIMVRQKITGFDLIENDEGEKRCAILLDKILVRVVPTPHRPFQGWRYLTPDDAPADISGYASDALPPHLLADLRDLGLL